MMTQTLTDLSLLSHEARKHIDEWLKKYPSDQKQSAVIAALTYVQTENGGMLTTELMDAVAAYLGMPKIAVYEVATFYSMYSLKPVGRHVINICTSVSCMLCGSKDIVKHLESKLKIRLGETTSDGRFTLKSVECLAACVGAPMMLLGKHYYENLTPSKVDEILSTLE
jgi:NADH-quinone oxidoreductase subunit E